MKRPTPPDPLAIVLFRGVRMDRKTAAALALLEQKLGYELTVVQGPYNPGGVGASAGTHDRGGVVDLAPYDWANKVRLARAIGFDAWRRTPAEGPWAEHIHMVLHGHQDLADSAYRQTLAYSRRTNGLVNDAYDPFPYHPERPPVFNYFLSWHDELLVQRIAGLRAKLKKIAERMSALRTRRAMLKAKLAAATENLKN